ncbi:MAG: permease [Pseudomonadota bacterium]
MNREPKTDAARTCCSTPAPQAAARPIERSRGLGKWVAVGALGLTAWWLFYSRLAPLAAWLTYGVLALARGTHLGASVEFFLFEAPKVLMLLVLVVFGVGIVRSFFTPERTRRVLAGRRESVGNVLAAVLGIVTPFCSCSAAPLFIGFVTTGVPLGVTLSFLISAPMVNEVALVLLFGLFGWQVAALYLVTGLLVAIGAGWVIGRLKLERHVEDWVYEEMPAGEAAEVGGGLTWQERVRFGREAVRDIVGRVWPYVLAGIAVGAGIHGYVPENMLASVMGRGAWWSVPLAVIIGVPMYSNAAGIIPVVQALLEKGAALGTVLAFMMSVIALSLPEFVILRRVLKPRLIAVFAGVVAMGILIVGYLFNLLPLAQMAGGGLK